jgi:hypothetical protein
MENQQIGTDKLVNVDAYQLYVIPKKVFTLLNQIFPGHTLVHHASVLIESVLILNKNLPAHQRCYVNIRQTNMDIIITERRKLLYYNAFAYTTKEDFIYYLLFVLEQMKLNPEEVELILTGYIDKNSSMFDIVYKYVRNISFASPSNTFQYSHIFNDIPKHYYFNLLNFFLCEL